MAETLARDSDTSTSRHQSWPKAGVLVWFNRLNQRGRRLLLHRCTGAGARSDELASILAPAGWKDVYLVATLTFDTLIGGKINAAAIKYRAASQL